MRYLVEISQETIFTVIIEAGSPQEAVELTKGPLSDTGETRYKEPCFSVKALGD